MGLNEAKDCLREYHLEDRIRLLDQSSATVELAALALGTEPAHIAKSLSFLVGDSVVMVLAAGDRKIDNGKYKQFFGTKAKMIPYEDVETLTGHPVGGVCPFGCKAGVEVYLDTSLQAYDTIYPAAGTPNSAVELSCEELERASGCKEWVDICK